jgi:hypothetical protein
VLVTLTVLAMRYVNSLEEAASQRKNVNPCVNLGNVHLELNVMLETTENSVPADLHLKEMVMFHVLNVSFFRILDSFCIEFDS